MWYNCADCIFATNSKLQADYHLEEHPEHFIVREIDDDEY